MQYNGPGHSLWFAGNPVAWSYQKWARGIWFLKFGGPAGPPRIFIQFEHILPWKFLCWHSFVTGEFLITLPPSHSLQHILQWIPWTTRATRISRIFFSLNHRLGHWTLVQWLIREDQGIRLNIPAISWQLCGGQSAGILLTLVYSSTNMLKL